MTTWTSASRRGAHTRTHRGDPAETHRDPLAEDHQDPLEDAHRVDPPEADHRAGEDPLDRADPAKALLEDPLGTPTTHQGTATRIPPCHSAKRERKYVQQHIRICTHGVKTGLG